MSDQNTGTKTIKSLRDSLLKTNPREKQWWEQLSPRQRRALLKLADLNNGFSHKEWEKISPSIQRLILNTAIQASNWARLILGNHICNKINSDSII